MALFFDAEWFDARLSDRGLDRAALALAAGIDRAELHRLFTNERSATAVELKAFADVLQSDIVEVTLRAGVSEREPQPGADASDRIESIEERLNAIDDWLAEFEAGKKRA